MENLDKVAMRKRKKPRQHKDYRKFKDEDLSILTPKEREIMMIKIEDADVSADDIAQKIGVSAKSVPVLLNRAVKKLDGTYPWEEVRKRNGEYQKTSEAHKKAMEKYYKTHKDELREYGKAYAKGYYQERKEEYADRNADYYQAHTEEIKKRSRDRYFAQNEGVRRLGSIDKCEFCGVEYIVKGGLQRFCSTECRKRSKRLKRMG